jgi:nucleoside-diphosphate-sugar epimerase
LSKRILVAGGTGFIGSHLCGLLLNEGHEVLCLDNFFTGRRRNIGALLDNLELRAAAGRRDVPDVWRLLYTFPGRPHQL